MSHGPLLHIRCTAVQEYRLALPPYRRWKGGQVDHRGRLYHATLNPLGIPSSMPCILPVWAHILSGSGAACTGACMEMWPAESFVTLGGRPALPVVHRGCMRYRDTGHGGCLVYMCLEERRQGPFATPATNCGACFGSHMGQRRCRESMSRCHGAAWQPVGSCQYTSTSCLSWHKRAPGTVASHAGICCSLIQCQVASTH